MDSDATFQFKKKRERGKRGMKGRREQIRNEREGTKFRETAGRKEHGQTRIDR